MFTLKKVWSFLRTHWYIPITVVGLIVFFFTSKVGYGELVEIIKKSRDSHKEEVGKLEEIHAEEIEKREVSIKRYHETVEEVEKQYSESNSSLDKKKKKQIKKIVDEVGNDPVELTKRVSALTGFDIVLPEN